MATPEEIAREIVAEYVTPQHTVMFPEIMRDKIAAALRSYADEKLEAAAEECEVASGDRATGRYFAEVVRSLKSKDPALVPTPS